MLHAVFNGHGTFALLAVLLSAAVGLVAFRKAPADTERPLWRGLFAASVTAVVSLTLWSTGGTSDKPMTCVVNRALMEPFFTEQGLWNAGLFLPVGFFGVLAYRKVLGVAVFGVLLTAAIETLQATLMFLGRGCDTSDLLMNSVGAATGALAGWFVTLLERPRSRFAHRWEARSAYAASASLVVIALAMGLLVEPQPMERTVAIGRATDEQELAVKEAVRAAFDGRVSVTDVQFAYGPGDTGTVTAQLSVGAQAELRWPDRSRFQATLDFSAEDAPTGYRVPGRHTAPKDARQAESIARAYAARHAGWGLSGTVARTSPAGETGELGWDTSWRRTDANGVLMPLRLDVQVDRTGRVSQVLMSNLPDQKVAEPRVRREEALAALLGPDRTGRPSGSSSAVLMAARRDGAWIPAWYVEVREDSMTTTGHVDALTGEAFDAEAP
ncbi:VanZ family protein [Streptomyces sp. NPDC056144]|uniref:VanZ family protein n=1 Tax=unclassified Streptomyces TaxID=2593676 RepID=UPI0035DED9A3